MAFLGVFWYWFKALVWKKYSKSKETKYLGFVKLGVGWAERDTYVFSTFVGSLVVQVKSLSVNTK